MKDRSCKHCKWRYEQTGFAEVKQMCDLNKEETKLDGYCYEFKENE